MSRKVVYVYDYVFFCVCVYDYVYFFHVCVYDLVYFLCIYIFFFDGGGSMTELRLQKGKNNKYCKKGGQKIKTCISNYLRIKLNYVTCCPMLHVGLCLPYVGLCLPYVDLCLSYVGLRLSYVGLSLSYIGLCLSI